MTSSDERHEPIVVGPWTAAERKRARAKRREAQRRYEGIDERHGRDCPTHDGGCCDCTPSYRAEVYSKREKKKIRRTFPTISAARSWRAEALGEVKRGKLRTPSRRTLREAAEQWLEGARAGTIRTRSGDPYKPSVIRSYESALRLYVLDDLGAHRLGEIARRDVQDLADRLLADGRDPSTIRNAIMPLRVIYRRALNRDEVTVNPTLGLELPAVRGRRERTAEPEELARLLAALPEDDRALWAMAMYAGLRKGELQALRLDDLDLARDPCPAIRVERSWDAQEGIVAPKSRAGVRSVPVVDELRRHLLAHKLRLGWNEGYLFGRSAETPFSYTGTLSRAKRAWKDAKLDPIGFHECRHSYVSLWHDAGVSLDRIGDYAGHSGSGITNRYRHLRDGRQAEDAALVNAHLGGLAHPLAHAGAEQAR